MKQFQVPQFIEVEDKIFGPLTLRQFLYILGGGSAVFLLYALLPLWMMIFFAIPVGAFFLALAFYKINGQPFIRVMESAIAHYGRARLFVWKKIERRRKKTLEEELEKKGDFFVPKLTESKLKELAWSLDIQEKIQRQ